MGRRQLSFSRKRRPLAMMALLAAVLLVSCRSELAVRTTENGTGAASASRLSGKVILPTASPVGAKLAGDPEPITCAASLQVDLVNRAKDPALTQVLASADVAKDGSFTLTGEALGRISAGASSDWALVVRGCEPMLSRRLTGMSGQNVSFGSSLVEFAFALAKAKDSRDVAWLRKLAGLLSAVEGARDFDDGFAKLSGTEELSRDFFTLFGIQPRQLEDAPPVILRFTTPSELWERQEARFSVSASHWRASYPIAYLWKWDNREIATLPNATLLPTANDQGLHTLSLYVGRRSDENGQLDQASPTRIVPVPLTVADTIPAVALDFGLVGKLTAEAPIAVNDRALALSLITGEDMRFCESFSALAMTENNPVVPADPAAYTIRCESPETQSLAFALKTAGDGPKVLRLWAMDAAGHISREARILRLVLDTTPPRARLTGVPAVASRMDSLTFGVTDPTEAGRGGVAVYRFKAGDSASVDCKDESGYGPERARSESFSVDLSGLPEVTVKLCAVARDDAGNWQPFSDASEATFLRLKTPPTASLQSTPGAVSAAPALAVRVSGARVTHYRAKVGPAASVDCGVEAGYGTETAVSQDITASVSAFPDGALTLCVVGRDAAENWQDFAAAASASWRKDTTPPGTFSLTTPPAAKGNVNAPTVAWETALDASSVTYDVTVATNPDCSGLVQHFPGLSATSQTLTALADGTYYLCLVARDEVGLERPAVNNASMFTVDTVAPNVTEFSLNGGSGSAMSRFVQVHLAASDARTKVTSFCLKTNNAAKPSAADPCWVRVDAPQPGLTPASAVSITGYNYELPLAPGSYSVTAWAKDEAQNVSSLTQSGAGTVGTDRQSIDYLPGTPPVVLNVLASRGDSPADPISQSDLTIAAGGDVYVKWQASDDQPLPATPIRLYYTTDDVTYTPISGWIPNARNGSCTVDHAGTTLDDGSTGCYLWTAGAPSSGYFQIRVEARDANGMSTFAASRPLNVPGWNFLAGNTESGIGGSATAAVFTNPLPYGLAVDPGAFVVDAKGDVYMRDLNHGILRISTQDGLVRQLIPVTGTSTGDGGPVQSATLKAPYKIALDYLDRVLVYDFDRIRRIDTRANPMTIETIIGGGASTGPDVDALALALPSYGTDLNNDGSVYARIFLSMFVLPDGRVFVRERRENEGLQFRIYDPATKRARLVTLNGIGDSVDSRTDVSQCVVWGFGVAFDPATSQVSRAYALMQHGGAGGCYFPESGTSFGTVYFNLETGGGVEPGPSVVTWNNTMVQTTMDGAMMTAVRVSINRINPVSGTFDTLAGNGNVGFCPDGTAALACAMNVADVFVSPAGRVYYMEHGLIRTINEAGKVVTLYGQSPHYGDGLSAGSARFGKIRVIRHWGDKVIVSDPAAIRLREFTRGGTIRTIAGNGNNGVADTVNPATSQAILMSANGPEWDMFAVNPANGDVFFNRFSGGNYRLAVLDRSTGLWRDLVGSGSINYFAAEAEGAAGNQILIPNYPPLVMGFDGTNVLASQSNYVTTLENVGLYQYDATTGAQRLFMGTGTSPAGNVYCADGLLGPACDVVTGYSWPYYHVTPVWDALGARYLFLTPGWPNVRTMSYGGAMGTLATLPRGAIAIAYKRNADLSTNIIYSCAGDGRIYKWDINAASETAAPWPLASVQCKGSSLLYDAANDSLIFPYTRNGLYGVLEIPAP